MDNSSCPVSVQNYFKLFSQSPLTSALKCVSGKVMLRYARISQQVDAKISGKTYTFVEMCGCCVVFLFFYFPCPLQLTNRSTQTKAEPKP